MAWSNFLCFLDLYIIKEKIKIRQNVLLLNFGPTH